MTIDSLLTSLGAGLYSLDSGYVRPRFDAVHLIVERGRVALIDSGTHLTVPRVLAALAALELKPDAVDWLILTHVHLDHAGGAGGLMQCLPAARLAVHPRGAPHLIDPSRLWAGTVAVYGQQGAEAAYGELVPVCAERILPTPDGTVIDLAGRKLICLDAPGHARHHILIHDPSSDHVFTGDTFGISYRELDVDGRAYIFPSSTPVQFDPAALRHTLRRLLDLRPAAACLTHWSRVSDVPTLGAALLAGIDRYEALAQKVDAQGLEPEDRLAALERGMDRLLIDGARSHGCRLTDETIRSLLDMDIRLNAAGLAAWLDSRSAKRASG